MTNIIFLIVCLITGLLLRISKRLPGNAATVLGSVILHIPLPAVILLNIPELNWGLDLLSLCLVAWAIFGLSFVTFRFLGPVLGLDQKMIGCLILTAGLGNTSFVGFPVVEAFFGKESLKHAVLIDQAGSFLIVSSLGIWVATYYSHGKVPFSVLLKKICTFPPFLAFVLAIGLSVFNLKFQGDARLILEKFGLLLAPLALLVVGLQLEFEGMRADAKYLFIGLGFKLFMAPLFIYILYRLFNVPWELFKISVFEAAMAPMTVASILAVSHGLHPRVASKMLGLGVPLSFLTLIFWYWVLHSV